MKRISSRDVPGGLSSQIVTGILVCQKRAGGSEISASTQPSSTIRTRMSRSRGFALEQGAVRHDNCRLTAGLKPFRYVL